MNSLRLVNRSSAKGASPIVAIIILGIGALLAIVVGTQLGTGDYVGALSWFVIGLGLIHLLYLHRFTWQIGLLLGFVGFTYYPIGFAIDSRHLGAVLAVVLAVISIVSTKDVDRLPDSRNGLGIVKAMLIIWCFYGAVHFAYTYVQPYDPSEFALRNTLKSYFDAYAGPLIVIFFLFRPHGLIVPKNWPVGVIWLLFLGVGLNVGLRLYFYSIGVGVDETSLRVAPLEVPVVNGVPSLYVLRSLGPLAVVFSYVFISSPGWLRGQLRITQIVTLMTFGLGIVGSLVSGGRGAILLAMLYFVGVAIMRRQVGLIGLGAAAAILFLVFVNVFASQINRSAPFFVARSLQWFMVEKGDSIKSIESSSNWRSQLFWMAISEWKSDPRIFMTGRSVYVYNAGDERVSALKGNYEGSMLSSLRRGATHANITDLLVQYGIIGAVIYLILKIAMIRYSYLSYCWAKANGMRDIANLGLLLFVCQLGSFPLTFIASNWINFSWFWLILVLAVLSSKFRGRVERRSNTSSSSVPGVDRAVAVS